MIYCLDTNVVVRALRGTAQGVKERLVGEGLERVMVPEMVRAELLTGARKSARPEVNLGLVEQFLAPFRILPFATEEAEHYADIRVDLERSGRVIGPNDLIIAAITRAAGATLVTGNLKEFERIRGLRCEDW